MFLDNRYVTYNIGTGNIHGSTNSPDADAIEFPTRIVKCFEDESILMKVLKVDVASKKVIHRDNASLDMIKDYVSKDIEKTLHENLVEPNWPGTNVQQQIYREKYVEAKAYADAGYPADLTDYEYLKDETDVNGGTAKKAAQDIIGSRKDWKSDLKKIEKMRRTINKGIRNCVNLEDVDLSLIEAKEQIMSTRYPD